MYKPKLKTKKVTFHSFKSSYDLPGLILKWLEVIKKIISIIFITILLILFIINLVSDRHFLFSIVQEIIRSVIKLKF